MAGKDNVLLLKIINNDDANKRRFDEGRLQGTLSLTQPWSRLWRV